MRTTRRSQLLLVPLLALAIVAAACGGDDNNEPGHRHDRTRSEEGGEFIDLGHLRRRRRRSTSTRRLNSDARRLPGHQRPVRRSHRDRLQRPRQPGDRRASWPSRSSRTTTPPSGRSRSRRASSSPTARRSCRARSCAAWERATEPDFAGDYSYLFNFIEGGKEKLDGTAPTPRGRQGRRRGDDPRGHAGRAVLQLRRGRRLPAVLPDAEGGRGADRPEASGRTAS